MAGRQLCLAQTATLLVVICCPSDCGCRAVLWCPVIWHASIVISGSDHCSCYRRPSLGKCYIHHCPFFWYTMLVRPSVLNRLFAQWVVSVEHAWPVVLLLSIILCIASRGMPVETAPVTYCQDLESFFVAVSHCCPKLLPYCCTMLIIWCSILTHK